MNKFNLTFWGEILEGRDPQKVKARFAKMFSIDAPERVEHFFSGDTIILRRNLERKVAAEYYSKLRKLGVEVELVKVEPAAVEKPPAHSGAPAEPEAAPEGESDWEKARRLAELEAQQRKAQRAAEQEQARQRTEAAAQQRRVEQEELKRQRAEAESRRKQEEEIRAREQAAAEAQRKTELEARRQQQAMEAAERKAAREKARQREAAEAARRKAELDEQKRIAREKAAAEKARKAEEKRKAAEALAKQRELEAEQKRQEEQRRKEQAAKEKARREEEKRKAAEALAKQRALEAEKKRLEVQRRKEQAAKEKARRAEEKRKAAEALAKQRALEAEQKRQEEQRRKEQAAKEKARRAEEKRKAAEALAKQRALEAEQKRLEEQHRKEQAAKEKARREEQKRKAAEELAKQQAAEAEKKRQEEQRRKEQAAREKAEREAEAARLRKEREAAQRAEKARREAERVQAAEERAQQRAERERRQAEEKRRFEEERRAEEAREREQEVQRQAMEERAIARAAEELSDMSALKSAQGRVTSSLELPRRDRDALPPRAKRQAGTPNFYSTHPFRNTSEVRERAAIAGRKKFTGLATAAIALAALMILTGRYLGSEPAPPITGPSAIAAAPSGALTILAGDKLLLHDRAGVGTESMTLTDMGIPGAVTPFSYDASGELLFHASPGTEDDSLTQLHRCSADFASCKPVPVEGRADAMTTHPLTGEIFLARSGRLVKLSRSGEPQAEAELPLPDKPVVLVHSGLLFANSRQGPAISVYRYEQSAFGKQLDEILLLPPPAVEKEQSRVRDFARAGPNWWVSLENPDTGTAGLYLFDSDWNYHSEVDPGAEWAHARLLTWGQKVLLWRDGAATIKRYAAGGAGEADLQSELLASLIDQQRRSKQLTNLAWAAGFSLLIAIAAVGAAMGCHQYLRSLVYHSRPTRGAEPVDEFTENIDWVDPAKDRAAAIKRLWVSYGALAVALCMLCIGFSVGLYALVAALIALCGPAIALVLFQRSQPAHVGTLEDQLILVDHRQMYHIARGPRIQYRGPFLLIDDVVVFSGTSAFPALCSEQLNSSVAPVAKAGARVDRKTVLVKLLDAGHPLAQGATIIGLALLVSLVVLAAGQFL